MLKIMQLVIALFSASLFLTSCGGGSSGEDNNGPIDNINTPPFIDSSLLTIIQQRPSYSSGSLIEISLDPSIDSSLVVNVQFDDLNVADRIIWVDVHNLQLLLPISENGEHTLFFELPEGFISQTLSIDVENEQFSVSPISYIESYAQEINNTLLSLKSAYNDNPELQSIIDDLLSDIDQQVLALSNLSENELLELAYFLKVNLAEEESSPRLAFRFNEVSCNAALANFLVAKGKAFFAISAFTISGTLAFYTGGTAAIAAVVASAILLKKVLGVQRSAEAVLNDCREKSEDELYDPFYLPPEDKPAPAFRVSNQQLSFAENVDNSYAIRSTFEISDSVSNQADQIKNELLNAFNDSVIANLIPDSVLEILNQLGAEFEETTPATSHSISNVSDASIYLCQSSFGQNLSIAFCFEDESRPAPDQSVSFSFDLIDSSTDPETITTYNATLTPAPVPIVYNSSVSQVQGLEVAGQLIADLENTFHISTNGTYGTANITNSNTGQFVYLPSNNGVFEDSFTFYATNEHGDSVTATVSVSMVPDDEPPVISITRPGNNELVSGIISLAVDVTDNVEVASAEFSVDGQFIALDMSEPYSTSFDTQSLETGSHTLTVESLDRYGNYSIESINFEIVQNTAPTPLINLVPSTGDTNTVFQADAYGTTDQEDLFSNLEFRWNWINTNFPNWDGISFSSDPTSSHTYTDPGAYRVWLQAMDSEGFASTTSQQIVVTVEPEISVYINGVEKQSSSTQTAHDFNQLTVYQDTGSVEVVVRNNGTDTLTINGFGVDYNGPSTDLTDSGDPVNIPLNLAPGNQVDFTLNYTPTTIVEDSSIIFTIHNNDDDESSFDLKLDSSVSPPPPPGVNVSAPQCVGNNSYAAYDFSVVSEANGVVSWPYGSSEFENSSAAWGRNSDVLYYSNGIVACHSGTVRTYNRLSGDLVATDEFGQVTTFTINFPSCELGVNYTGWSWSVCSEYY